MAPGSSLAAVAAVDGKTKVVHDIFRDVWWLQDLTESPPRRVPLDEKLSTEASRELAKYLELTSGPLHLHD